MSPWQERCLRTFPHYWQQESRAGRAQRARSSVKLPRIFLHILKQSLQCTEALQGRFENQGGLTSACDTFPEKPNFWARFTKLPVVTSLNLIWWKPREYWKEKFLLALLEILAQHASGHPRVCTTPVPRSRRQENHKSPPKKSKWTYTKTSPAAPWIPHSG